MFFGNPNEATLNCRLRFCDGTVLEKNFVFMREGDVLSLFPFSPLLTFLLLLLLLLLLVLMLLLNEDEGLMVSSHFPNKGESTAGGNEQEEDDEEDKDAGFDGSDRPEEGEEGEEYDMGPGAETAADDANVPNDPRKDLPDFETVAKDSCATAASDSRLVCKVAIGETGGGAAGGGGCERGCSCRRIRCHRIERRASEFIVFFCRK